MNIRTIARQIGYKNLPAYYVGREMHGNEYAWKAYNRVAGISHKVGIVKSENYKLVRNLILHNPPEPPKLSYLKKSIGATITLSLGLSYIFNVFNRLKALGDIEDVSFKIPKFIQFIAEHSGNIGLIGIPALTGLALDSITQSKKSFFLKISTVLTTSYFCLGEFFPIVFGNTMDWKDAPFTFLAGVGIFLLYEKTAKETPN